MARRSQRRWASVPLWAGTVSVVVGVAVLVGWVLDVDWLKQVHPGLPRMKATTATGFILIGSSMTLLARRPVSLAGTVLARCCAVAVGLIGLVVVGEYLFGGVGVDTPLFGDTGPYPGRPSPHLAVAFVLVSATLLVFRDDAERLRRTFVTLLWLDGAVVLMALLGFAFGVEYLRGLAGVTGISVHGVLTLAVVWVGLAWLRPGGGAAALWGSDRPSAVLVRRTAPAAVLVAVLSGVVHLVDPDLAGYTPRLDTTLSTLVMISTIGLVLWRAARALDAADDRRGGMERLSHGLLESAPDAMVVVDRTGQIVRVNAQAEKLFGYGRGELVGRPLQTLIPARHHAGHEGHVARFFASRTARPMGAGLDLNAMHRDGHEIPVEISLSAFDAGDVPLVSAAVRDVTERKLASEALSASEERFRRLFEEAPIGMALIGLDGRFLRVNGGMCEITSRSPEELTGTSVAALTHPDDVPTGEESRRALLSGRSTVHRAELRLLRPGGEPVWVGSTTSLARDADGRPLHVICQVQDISERRHAQVALQHLADHDALTGLVNRRRFEEELRRELMRSHRYGTGGALLTMDLDHFKDLNDTLGHSAGDLLIKRAAELWRGRLRTSDVLGRLGGDEFALLLPHADRDQAETVAGNLLDSMRRNPVDLPGGTRHFTSSIGIALFDDPALTCEQVLVHADVALYASKEGGRDRATVFSGEGDGQYGVQGGLAWVERLRHALEEDRFVLHAQPIRSLAGGLPRRHELLLRMVDEAGGLVAPQDFLPVAERFDLVRDLDRWVLREAIALLGREQRAGRDVHLQVNVSASTLGDPELVDVIGRHLAEVGADGRGLCLEIAQSTTGVDLHQARQLRAGLAALGCELALGQVGSGFASSWYDRNLDVDILKIDGTLVAGLRHDRTSRVIVEAIVHVARGLGRHTIAERVEDDVTLDLLRTYGVDYAQGYHVARPRPVAEIDLASRTVPA